MPADNPFGLPPKTTTADGVMVWHPGFEWTGGGLVSNARDLAVWGAALFGGQAMPGDYLDDLLQKAHQIQLDILSGNFDDTLAKYKSDPVQTLKTEPKTPPLTQLWESFYEVKQPVVAPGTWRNGYCVNTGPMETYH